MASLKFFAIAIDDSEKELTNIISYELSRDIDAACDGLRLRMFSEKPLDELVKIKAYSESELVFNGLVDVQRDSVSSNGGEVFIYARSSACVLLDNEAFPRNYHYPTALALFHSNAERFGFINKLPAFSSKYDYLVNKGVSCFGAINNFVNGICSKSIVVSPMNEIILPSGDGKLDFNTLEIISERRAINRGSLVSRIDYKADGDIDYSHHIKSRFFEKRGINSSRKINLSNLPLWQREFTAKTSLLSSAKDYYNFEIIVDGCVNPQLYDRATGRSLLQALDGYYITSVCIIYDEKGERTRIELAKEIELEDITYVVEQGY